MHTVMILAWVMFAIVFCIRQQAALSFGFSNGDGAWPACGNHGCKIVDYLSPVTK